MEKFLIIWRTPIYLRAYRLETEDPQRIAQVSGLQGVFASLADEADRKRLMDFWEECLSDKVEFMFEDAREPGRIPGNALLVFMGE